MTKEQKKMAIRRGIYMFAFFFVIVGTAIVYLYANGWRLDPFKQELIKTGVITVESEPFLANVYINNEEKGRTPRSTSLPIGIYNVKVTRDGYVDWYKDVEVKEEKSTPVFPWLIRKDITSSNIFTKDDESFVNSWVNETKDHIFILTSKTDGSTYTYSILRYDVNTTFWDLSSNPKVVFSTSSTTPLTIDLNLSPSGLLAVMTIQTEDTVKKYFWDSSKMNTKELLEEIDIVPFSDYTMSWSKNNGYLIFESNTDLISFNTDKQTRYLLLKKLEGKTYIWTTDEQGYFYSVELKDEDEKIYEYTLNQTEMDGSNPKSLISSIFLQKNTEYILPYREETGDGKYLPFKNSPESIKSVGSIEQIRVNQNAKGAYIKTDTASYWYDISTQMYILISPYATEYLEMSYDNKKILIKDDTGYNIFTFDKEDGDHTTEIGTKLLISKDEDIKQIRWLSNSSYLYYTTVDNVYIIDIDGDNKTEILSKAQDYKYIGITYSKENMYTVKVSKDTQKDTITIDRYLIH